jgi:hypothetical protein
MKALNFKIILLVGISVLAFSCKKETSNPEVNPLESYLIATGFNEKTTNQIDLGNYEFGLAFKPLVNGKITALVVKIPDVNAALRMTIWNKTSATILKTETINYATAGVEVTTAISGINLTAGTEYMVTFNSNDWYDRRRNASTNATYPVTVGDISITAYSFISGSAQSLPNSPQLSYYAGDISFKFQKD